MKNNKNLELFCRDDFGDTLVSFNNSHIFNNDLLNSLHILGNNSLVLHNITIANVLALLSIICAIYTILSKNPIISVLFLIGLYINIAGYLMIVGSQFIGLSYVLIYIGAISILFIFILMLINIRISELFLNNKNSLPLIIILAIILNYILYNYLFNNNGILFENNENYYINTSNIYNITNIIWDGIIIKYHTVSSLGNILYSNNFILFIIASIILLLAMIGAIIITIKPVENYKIIKSNLHVFSKRESKHAILMSKTVYGVAVPYFFWVIFGYSITYGLLRWMLPYSGGGGGNCLVVAIINIREIISGVTESMQALEALNQPNAMIPNGAVADYINQMYTGLNRLLSLFNALKNAIDPAGNAVTVHWIDETIRRLTGILPILNVTDPDNNVAIAGILVDIDTIFTRVRETISFSETGMTDIANIRLPRYY